MPKILGRSIGLAIVGLFAATCPDACAVSLFNLGSASNFTVLQIGNGVTTQQGEAGGITGNIGVTSGGGIHNSGPLISGDLYLGNNASAQFSGSYGVSRPVAGTVHVGSSGVGGISNSTGAYSFTTVSDNPQALLNQARMDAINASAAANTLAATSVIGNINTSMTLYGTGVYYLNSLSLGSGDVLTLSGSSTDQFVFNISSTFMLNGGKILLTGGLTEANVLFNFTGTNKVTFSSSDVASELHGIVLALNAQVAISSGLIVGEVISAQDIALVNSDLAHTSAVPEVGGSLVLLTLSLIGLGVFRVWSRRNVAVAIPTTD